MTIIIQPLHNNGRTEIIREITSVIDWALDDNRTTDVLQMADRTTIIRSDSRSRGDNGHTVYTTDVGFYILSDCPDCRCVERASYR